MSSLDSLLDTVLTNTFEVDVLHHRLTLWRSMLEKHLFSEGATSGDTHVVLSATLARAAFERSELPEHVEAVETWMRSIRSLTRDNAYDLFTELEQSIEALPVLTLFIAVDFSRKDREQLGEWARQNVHPQVLLDIRIDPSIIAGVVMVWRDSEIDFSVRARLRQGRETLRTALIAVRKSSSD